MFNLFKWALRCRARWQRERCQRHVLYGTCVDHYWLPLIPTRPCYVKRHLVITGCIGVLDVLLDLNVALFVTLVVTNRIGLAYIHLFSEVLVLRSPFASENKIRWVFKSPQLNFGHYSTVCFTADARLGFKLMTRLFFIWFQNCT